MQDQSAQTAANSFAQPTSVNSTQGNQISPVQPINSAQQGSYVDAYTPPPTVTMQNPVSIKMQTDPLTQVNQSAPVGQSRVGEQQNFGVSPKPNLNPTSGVASDQDAQKALDELAKMFEEVDTVHQATPPIVSSSPVVATDPAPAFPWQKPVAPVNKPVATQHLVPTPSAQAKSSDDLLKEIEVALEEKKNQLNLAKTPVQSGVVTPSVSAPIISQPTNAAPSHQARPVMDSEALEDQNIFHLLGIDDGSNEQKDQFLNELQQVIWEDFLDHDVELLLTEAEYKELKAKYQVDQKKPLAEQEEVIVYLEKLIPDLESLMLEKAIKLKADLVKERVMSLREKFVSDPQKLSELDKIDGVLAQDKWLSAARALNNLV